MNLAPLFERLPRLFRDPPPLLVFEISEGGVAAVRRDAKTLEVEAQLFREFEPGVIECGPGKPGLAQPEPLRAVIESLIEELGPVRRPDVALLLPDGSSRLAVLDFDHLPADGKERLNLIQFRLNKSVPFEIESTRIAFHAQRTKQGWSVLAAVTPAEVVRQYEAPFRELGFWPGYVAPASAAALNLAPEKRMTLLAKRGGRRLMMAAVDNGIVRMTRSVDLSAAADDSPQAAVEEMVGDLYPTLVFVADDLKTPVSKLLLCGFGEWMRPALERLPGELSCEVEAVRSPRGIVQPQDAGVWGYLSVN